MKEKKCQVFSSEVKKLFLMEESFQLFFTEWKYRKLQYKLIEDLELVHLQTACFIKQLNKFKFPTVRNLW